MSIEGLIVGLVILANVVFWVVTPLLLRDAGDESDALAQKQHERLLSYYERVLRNIRDLDEDHATGKMPDADYDAEREEWMRRGVQVLKALDTLDVQAVETAADDAAIDEAIDAEIERAIAARRREARVME